MGISIWQLMIVLIIVLLLFGTKKLRNLGGDLGSSIKSFRDAVRDGGEEAKKEASGTERLEKGSGEVIEGEVTSKEKDRA